MRVRDAVQHYEELRVSQKKEAKGWLEKLNVQISQRSRCAFLRHTPTVHGSVKFSCVEDPAYPRIV